MRRLMFVVVLLVIGIAGFGYYRGWFAFTVDKDKFHQDEQTTRERVQGAGQEAKEKVDNLTGGKVKEPQRQP